MFMHDPRYAGGGAGVRLVFSGKSRKFRVTKPDLHGLLTVDSTGDVDGLVHVTDLSLESYEDMKPVDMAGSIQIQSVDRDFVNELISESGPGDISASIQEVNDVMLSPGFVRGPAPTRVDVDGLLTLEHDDGNAKVDVPFTGTFTTTSYFRKAWASLDEIDEDDADGIRAASDARTAAKTPGGLYGFKKSVQADCESAIRKMSRKADQLARQAYAKDENVAPFLATHAKEAKSLPAKILVAAMKSMGPKIASGNSDRLAELRALRASDKTAGKRQYGLYGFLAKTASLGLGACTQLRESAGHVASDLHGRRAAIHPDITGFLDSHSKEARCMYSKLLRASYPSADRKTASVPQSTEDWLTWEG